MTGIVKKWHTFMTTEKQALYNDVSLLVLRLSLGLMMLFSHGIGKMNRLFADGPVKFADPIGIGKFPSLVLASGAEVICSILIVLGLFTRLSTIPLIITMAVAALIVHAGDPFAKQEFGLLYLFGYIVLMLQGPGRFSIDAQLRNKVS